MAFRQIQIVINVPVARFVNILVALGWHMQHFLIGLSRAQLAILSRLVYHMLYHEHEQ